METFQNKLEDAFRLRKINLECGIKIIAYMCCDSFNANLFYSCEMHLPTYFETYAMIIFEKFFKHSSLFLRLGSSNNPSSLLLKHRDRVRLTWC
jgi:hypothetical protein